MPFKWKHYIRALQTIPGIYVVNNLENQGFFIFREGSKNFANSALKVMKWMSQRQAEDGRDLSKTLKRILDSCRIWGEIFYYHPDAVADFEANIKKQLEAEQARAPH